MPEANLSREAKFSPCERYRYTLHREWPPRLFDAKPGMVNFIMLNPSTADQFQDDPTIRRCMGYAADWGYSQLCVTNIFAFRATDPKVMRSQVDPVGPENDAVISIIANLADIIITAWGSHGEHNGRSAEVIHQLKRNCGDRLHYLKKTNAGEPSHPLYLPRVLMPIKWQ